MKNDLMEDKFVILCCLIVYITIWLSPSSDQPKLADLNGVLTLGSKIRIDPHESTQSPNAYTLSFSLYVKVCNNHHFRSYPPKTWDRVYASIYFCCITLGSP